MIEEFMATSITSIIDQNIDPAQSFGQNLCHILHLFRVGYIAGDGKALAAHCLNLAHELFNFAGSACGDGHIRPCLSKCQGDATTNTPTCASHYSSSPCKCGMLHKKFSSLCC